MRPIQAAQPSGRRSDGNHVLGGGTVLLPGSEGLAPVLARLRARRVIPAC
jgi:hypothetical protein